MPVIDQSLVGKDLPTLLKQGDSRSILRFIRVHKLREPEIVYKHGLALLNKWSKSSPFDGIFGSTISEAEYLAIIEQTYLMSLEMRMCFITKRCIDILEERFPGKINARMFRIFGMALECSKDYPGAEDIYNNMLTKNPSSAIVLQRKYCILRAQPGKEVETRTAMSNYLEKFAGDAGAWNEMCEMCLEVGDFNSAAFCLEEIVLSQPLDTNLHCKLGEVYATLGGIDNMKLARKHLAQALDIEPENKRALYSLIAVSSEFIELASKSKIKVNEVESDIAMELLRFSSEQLQIAYEGSELQSIVKAVLDDYESSLPQNKGLVL